MAVQHDPHTASTAAMVAPVDETAAKIKAISASFATARPTAAAAAREATTESLAARSDTLAQRHAQGSTTNFLKHHPRRLNLLATLPEDVDLSISADLLMMCVDYFWICLINYTVVED
mmetsp:Transcript_10319/g.15329  ORF Transcript_10319/g.15329 Transcript_10319/m.15329 type:complete len:118 (+) Transcript_10319:270-623(+)